MILFFFLLARVRGLVDEFQNTETVSLTLMEATPADFHTEAKRTVPVFHMYDTAKVQLL